MKKGKEIYMYALGALIVISVIAVICLLIFVQMPKDNEQVLLVLLGVLAASFTAVVSYFYGSSKGSSDKTELLNRQAGNSEEKPNQPSVGG